MEADIKELKIREYAICQEVSVSPLAGEKLSLLTFSSCGSLCLWQLGVLGTTFVCQLLVVDLE